MLGSRIAMLRSKAGLTQAALADRLHVSSSAVGMYEQGRREPPSSILMALSKEFGVTVDYLLTGHVWSKEDIIIESDLLMDTLRQAYFLQSYCTKDFLRLLIILKCMDQKKV